MENQSGQNRLLSHLHIELWKPKQTCSIIKADGTQNHVYRLHESALCGLAQVMMSADVMAVP